MNSSEVIYLDHNSTTPVDEIVLDAMLPMLRGQFGNPASGHVIGRAARSAVELSRESVARLLGQRSGRIVFTSSATEANNLAICGLTAALPRPLHVITSAIEHPSVLEPFRRLEELPGVRVTWVPTNSFGQVSAAALQACFSDDTRIVSLQAANGVIHSLNPVADLAGVCRARGALFHCDATQWVGRLPVDVERWQVDALSLSAHKFYGPKGAGALYISEQALRAGPVPQLVGGGQESGDRKSVV